MGKYRFRATMIACLVGLGALGITGTGTATPPAQDCASDDVRTAFGERYFASHTYWVTVHITANPGVTCILPAGHPFGLGFADADGAPLPVYPSPTGPAEPVTVTPDSPAHFELIMEGYALEQEMPATFTFTLPGADRSSTVAWGDQLQYHAHLSYCAVRPGLGDVTDYAC